MANSEQMELMGIGVPLGDESGLEHMATCFAEEFARMGYSYGGLLAVFRNPFYQGPHLAYQRKGEAWIREMIARVCGAGEEEDRVGE